MSKPDSQTTPHDELRGKLESIKRGIESILLDAELHEEPINPEVLMCIKRDIDTAINTAWSDYAPF